MEFSLSTILMWIFVVIMIVGLWLTYRTINGSSTTFYKHKFEGPIVIAAGLVLSVLTGILSGGETTESFKTLYGLN